MTSDCFYESSALVIDAWRSVDFLADATEGGLREMYF